MAKGNRIKNNELVITKIKILTKVLLTLKLNGSLVAMYFGPKWMNNAYKITDTIGSQLLFFMK